MLTDAQDDYPAEFGPAMPGDGQSWNKQYELRWGRPPFPGFDAWGDLINATD